MTVINTNTAATITANALSKNERAMSQTMERPFNRPENKFSC